MKLYMIFVILLIGDSTLGMRFVGETVPTDEDCFDLTKACETFESAEVCGMTDMCAKTAWSVGGFESELLLDEDRDMLAILRTADFDDQLSSAGRERNTGLEVECEECKSRINNTNAIFRVIINGTMGGLCEYVGRKHDCMRMAVVSFDRLVKELLSPDKICESLGACRNKTHDHAVNPCDTCRLVFDLINDGLASWSPVVDSTICYELPRRYQRECYRMFRSKRFPQRMFRTRQDGIEACTALHFCKDEKNALESDSKVTVPKVNVKQGSCEECQKMVDTFNAAIKDVVHHTAQDICEAAGLPSLVKQCLNWSKTYEKDFAKDILLDHLAPKKVCEKAGSCFYELPYIGAVLRDLPTTGICTSLRKACETRENAETCGVTEICNRVVWRMKREMVGKQKRSFFDVRSNFGVPLAEEGDRLRDSTCYNCKAMVENFNTYLMHSPVVNDTVYSKCGTADEFCDEWSTVYLDMISHCVSKHHPSESKVCKAVGACK